ncbi:MAG: DUF2975 domain-containing protein [Lachnospiraceae bacterium]|nr:DUF2975 domain-containing protein [Lachnospiraceae bacterium]
MEQKALATWLKIIIIGVGICGLVVYFIVFPSYGQSIVNDYPEFANRFLPWLVFLWITAIPCYAAFVFGWKIAVNIGRDKSFSNDNASYLKWIAWFATADAIFFFVGNIVLWLADMSHPGVVLLSLIVVFAGVAIAVASAGLSHLVQKAAALQEQSDLTI